MSNITELHDIIVFNNAVMWVSLLSEVTCKVPENMENNRKIRGFG